MQRYLAMQPQGHSVEIIVGSQMPFQVVFQSPSALTETAVSVLFSDPPTALLRGHKALNPRRGARDHSK